MTNLTLAIMKKYLSEEYLIIEQLSTQTGISPERIMELIENQCIPPHTYEVIETATITCAFSPPVVVTETIRYYHPSITSWILKAENLSKNKTLTDVAIHIRETFFQEYKEKFQGQATPGCKNINTAWYYLMNGTWGICLKEISVACMANKELSRLKIATLLNSEEGKHFLSEASKKVLQSAIDTYEIAAKEFSPHLASTSSRACEIVPARKKLNDSDG